MICLEIVYINLLHFRFSVCNEGPCATWWVDYWEECSVTCGPKGIQSRYVECLDMITEDYSNECSNSTKPRTSRPCPNLEPCPSQDLDDVISSSPTCLRDLLSLTVCKRYIKLCDRNSRFRKKCCKTCEDNI